ncbi:MAG: bifunctional hydroxymethylpyrimidine kinase/phosphomethylpyrimidine kinase [Phycisphaeraceae bacterium]|nr:bifunctional hydroxymethylpyrimidine kinase/phosphomethylpyrimidine kinase [Phycisphaeraceae bacterium]
MAERTVPGVDVALTIAGSDSSGGAGIQADLKVFSVMDVYGASAITAITAQNTLGVRQSLVLDPALVVEQIDAVASDFPVKATKTGMLGHAAMIEAVARRIAASNLFPLVVDPVMVAKSGASLIDDDAVSVLAKKLLPLATLTTPNLAEAGRLLGRKQPIADEAGAQQAAREICARFGVKACLVKGLRREDEHEGVAVDFFFDGRDLMELTSPWRPTTHTHGSGCAFSAAVTAALAKGKPLPEALAIAKTLISEAIRQTTGLGAGRGPVNVLSYLKLKA